MFHTKERKAIRDTNRLIDHAKKKRVNQYYHELSRYIDKVSKLSLEKIIHDANTEDGFTSCTGNMQDELGIILSNPPSLGDLSLPAFLSDTDTINKKSKNTESFLNETGKGDSKIKVEVIDLPKGYLYISVNYTKGTYKLAYHTNTAELNKYLDMGKNIKTVTPTLLRDGAIVGTSAFGIQRVVDLVKTLVALLVLK